MNPAAPGAYLRTGTVAQKESEVTTSNLQRKYET